jgi:hypothetical protein
MTGSQEVVAVQSRLLVRDSSVTASAFASTDGETSYNPTVPQRRTSGTSAVVLVSELRIFYLPAS